MKHIEITGTPIDLMQVMAFVSHPNAGGEVLFVGTTRSWTASRHSDHPGRETAFLVYQSHESMALNQLESIAAEATKRWELLSIVIIHRIGKVLPQEPSIAIAVSTPHRAEAYAASRWIIDSIKRDVPIWKQEHYKDNSPEWIHPDDSPCCSIQQIDSTLKKA